MLQRRQWEQREADQSTSRGDGNGKTGQDLATTGGRRGAKAFEGALTILFALPLSAEAQAISQTVRLDASLGEGLGLVALVLLYGLLSALLLRSWRSLLVVPASLFVGWEAGSVGDALFHGHALDEFTLLNAAGTFLLLLAPLMIGAAAGTGIGLRSPRGGAPEQRLKLEAQAKWLHLPS